MQRIAHRAAVVKTTAESLSRFRRTLATAGVGLLALFLGLHVIFGHNGMLAYQRKRAEYQKFQEEVNRLQKENDRISQQVRELKSDPKAIEREAREQLRYARPGEVVYTMPEPVRPQPPISATAQRR